MIKLNLNKTKTSIDQGMPIGTTVDSTRGSMIESLQTALGQGLQNTSPVFFIKIIINIVLILAFPLGLKIYEIQQINKLEVQKQKEELLLAQTTEQFNNLKTELDSYGHLKQKSEEFARKKGIFKKINRRAFNYT